jgi:hypothetical protein
MPHIESDMRPGDFAPPIFRTKKPKRHTVGLTFGRGNSSAGGDRKGQSARVNYLVLGTGSSILRLAPIPDSRGSELI